MFFKALAVALAAIPLSGCWFDSPLLTVCEKMLKERLASPSTYRRISTSMSDNPLSSEAIAQTSPAKAANMNSSGISGKQFTLMID